MSHVTVDTGAWLRKHRIVFTSVYVRRVMVRNALFKITTFFFIILKMIDVIFLKKTARDKEEICVMASGGDGHPVHSAQQHSRFVA